MEVKAVSKELKQYVVFKVADQEFGTDIHKVSIIEKTMNITRVPTMPSYIKGVVNLRGEIIPVMSLRLKFGLPEIEADDDARVVIFKLNDIKLGVLVDAVAEVVTLKENDIESVTLITNDRNYDYIIGVAKVEGRLITLLNIEKLISELTSRN
jgi:purine-binding chemotaxis protein CheW